MKNNFKPNAIRTADELIAAELRGARLARNLKIDEAAKCVNIKCEYLKALESAEPEKLPPGVYRNNFLREYANFLGLDSRKMIKDFSDENVNKEINKKGFEAKDIFSQQVVGRFNFLIFPKLIRNIVIIAIFLIFIFYLGFYLRGIFSSAELEILQPSDNLIVNNSFIDIVGRTESEVQVTINGELIPLEKSGGEIIFTKRIDLKKGINTITIVAVKKYGKPKTIVRQVLTSEI